MIDLHNISQQKPEIVLRGEFGIVSGDSLIIAPNAKNGKIVILVDPAKQIAAVAHFDNATKVEENMNNIFGEMKNLGSEIKDLQCNVMEKESEKTFKEKIQKSFKEKVADALGENGNDQEVDYTSWSGNDFCNVVLKGTGDLLIDNSSELMRTTLNLLIFTAEGDARLNNAMNPALIIELKKIKGSAIKRTNNEESINIQVLQQTKSMILSKVSTLTRILFKNPSLKSFF